MTSALDQARSFFQQGLQASEAARWPEAETFFAQALTLAPGRPSLLANLALARVRGGRAEQALGPLAELLQQEPDNAANWALRGEALTALGRWAEALPCHERVLALDPAHRVAMFERATALQALARLDEALQAYTALLALEPGHAAAWQQRGAILKDSGRLADAAESFRRALAHSSTPAERELNEFFLASVTAQHQPSAAPRPYVEALFDSYADQFDQHLTSTLNYRTPQLLAELLPAGWEVDAALDLGCGTGLMAPLLRGRAAAIDGVDLSRQMLAKAAQLGLYRELAHGDVVEFLQRTPQRYDLVVAADVFVYIGELAAVFDGVAHVLAPGGLFLFSVEQADAGHDLQLRASSRYAHSAASLRTLAEARGLAVHAVRGATLREDQGRPILGWLFLIGR